MTTVLIVDESKFARIVVGKAVAFEPVDENGLCGTPSGAALRPRSTAS